jgi:hypothetical protein
MIAFEHRRQAACPQTRILKVYLVHQTYNLQVLGIGGHWVVIKARTAHCK